MKQLKEALMIAWVIAVGFLAWLFSYNLRQIMASPAAPLTDIALWCGAPAALWVMLLVFRNTIFGIKVPSARKDDFPVPPVMPPVATDKAEYDLSLPGGCRVSVTLLGKVGQEVTTKVKELLALAAGGAK